jgi:hypothetical protein
MQPVRRSKRSVTVDFLALEKAILAGTLSDEDRRFIERLFPGECERLASGNGTTVTLARVRFSAPRGTLHNGRL